jgi:hypothetical protein
MIKKQFKELVVGDTFTYNGLEYVKIKDEKVSCCRTLNAAQASDETKKVMVPPITEIEVNG